MKTLRLEEGMDGFLVGLNRRSPHQAQVARVLKVGRKWARIESLDPRGGWSESRDRFAVEGGYADGGQYTSPGRFVTQEVVEWESLLAESRLAFRRLETVIHDEEAVLAWRVIQWLRREGSPGELARIVMETKNLMKGDDS